jgi:hypothetical protein
MMTVILKEYPLKINVDIALTRGDEDGVFIWQVI